MTMETTIHWPPCDFVNLINVSISEGFSNSIATDKSTTHTNDTKVPGEFSRDQ